MKQLHITGPGQFEVVDMEPPAPAPGELLVSPLLVGVCATDRELFDGSLVHVRDGRTVFPLTPGHEWVGRVAGVGEGTTGFTIGDTVVGECSIGCGACSFCATGAYHQCPDRRETGIFGQTGGLTEQFTFPANSAHVVPNSVELADAALIEPTAVAYRAITKLGPTLDHPVLVVGAGTLGYLVAIQLASVFNADVAVIDPRDDYVERLAEFGVRRAKSGETFSSIVEAAGHPSAFESALSRLRPGGSLVVIGLSGHPTIPVPLDAIVVGDQAILGSLGSPSVWPKVIGSIASGAIHPSRLVAATVPLSRYAEAITRTDGKILIALPAYQS